MTHYIIATRDGRLAGMSLKSSKEDLSDEFVEYEVPGPMAEVDGMLQDYKVLEGGDLIFDPMLEEVSEGVVRVTMDDLMEALIELAAMVVEVE